MELFSSRISSAMIHKITDNQQYKHKKHTMYYDSQNKCYIKVFNYFSQFFWETHPMLLDKYYPNYLINKEHDEKSMTITYKEIEGNRISKDKLQDLNALDRLYTWCVSEIQRTTPYSHGDWHPKNILTKDYQTFNMIDFDTFGQDHIEWKGIHHSRTSYHNTIKMLHHYLKEDCVHKQSWKQYWKWKKGKQWKGFLNVELY